MQLITLANSLRTVLVPCEAESVAFGLFVASGSRHETQQTEGISHFIEHMLFKGTPTRTPLQITRAIEGRGGNFNAWTSEESTAYFAHMPAEYLPEAVDIISDMYLNASIPEDEFRRERQVVLEEIKMYADEPDAVAMENLQRALFSPSRLGAPVAGSARSLMKLRREDLVNHIGRRYRPDNTVAVVVGNFDPDRAAKLVDRALGGVRRRAKAEKADKVDFSRPTVAEIKVAKDVQQVQLALGYRTFGLDDPRRYAATVFDAVMGRGMSSRLFQAVREKRALSYDISSRMQFFSDAGMWTVSAGTDGAKAGTALATIDRELDRIRSRKVPAAELRRTKEFLTGNFRLAHERVTSKLFYYGSTMLAYNRPVPTEEQVAGIMAVTADDVAAVAAAILDESNRSLSWVVPKT
jgi:predicted Zn-dependent peptidase